MLIVAVPITCINTNAATFNAVATSTKDAISGTTSLKTKIENKFNLNKAQSMNTLPSVERTIDKYIAYATETATGAKTYLANLEATQAMSNTLTKVKKAVPFVLSPAESTTALIANLSIMFMAFVLAQLYFKKNEVKILLLKRRVNIKYNVAKDKAKFKINSFNKNIMNMLQEETKKEPLSKYIKNVNKKTKYKPKIKYIHKKGNIPQPVLLDTSTSNRVNYIDDLIVKHAYNGVVIRNRGHRPKCEYALDSS